MGPWAPGLKFNAVLLATFHRRAFLAAGFNMAMMPSAEIQLAQTSNQSVDSVDSNGLMSQTSWLDMTASHPKEC